MPGGAERELMFAGQQENTIKKATIVLESK